MSTTVEALHELSRLSRSPLVIGGKGYAIGPGPQRCGIDGEVVERGRCPGCETRRCGGYPTCDCPSWAYHTTRHARLTSA
jgi:hypothetical protein